MYQNWWFLRTTLQPANLHNNPRRTDFLDNKKNNKLWFKLTELWVQFPLAHGNVIARIAPYEPNLRKVLEACADVTPQAQMPEPAPSKGESSLPNSSLFDSVKTQGKPLTP